MQLKITDNEAGQRFDRFLRKYFKNSPEIKLAEIYSWIRKGFIKINGRKTAENYKLDLGDEIYLDENLFDKKNPIKLFKPKSEKKLDIDLPEIKKQILLEDDNRIFWNKPVGVVIHEGDKHATDLTLNDYLDAYLHATNQIPKSETFTPAFGFRLDKDTSGIIVGAKNYEALKYLNEIIKNRKTKKTYLAIVKGDTPKEFEIKDKLKYGFDRKTGKSITFVTDDDDYEGLTSHTKIKLLKLINDKHLGEISFLEVQILTGRMHQIRVHLASRGFPIIGDLLYGERPINNLARKHYQITRQLLHSFKYSFFDQFQKQEIGTTCEMPEDFRKIVGRNA